MPSLLIENVPVGLLARMERAAKAKNRTLEDTALEVLETAFRVAEPTYSEAPLPSEPFLTEEICAPCSIPRLEGTPVCAIHVEPPLPDAHDIPDSE